MSERTRIVLVRHAQPTADTRGRCYGTLDVGLSATGRRQARLLASALESAPLAALYVSPSRRALDTAAPVATAHSIAPTIDPRLGEIDFGEFEGRSYAEIERSHPDVYRQWMATPTLVRFPGGESYRDLRIRALAALATIRTAHSGALSAIVTHAGVLATMISVCLQMPPEAMFRLDQSHAAISIIDWIDEVPMLRLLNLAPAGGAAARRRLAPLLARSHHGESVAP